jgi:hypothetical protein
MKAISSLFLFALLFVAGGARADSRAFASAQEAVAWAEANRNASAGITHITITGNNSEADLLQLRRLNSHSEGGLFCDLESLELSTQTGALPHNCFYEAYSGAQWLKRFSAPCLTHVGNWAFRFCTRLAEVSLPGVAGIGDFAFYGSGLTAIHLPASLTGMGANPFLGCQSLNSITVDEANECFTSENGVLYNAAQTLLIAYPAGKTEAAFTAPATVAGIGQNAFGICTGLAEMTLPAATDLRDWAAEHCSGLETVAFDAPGAIAFGAGVFSAVETANIDLLLNAAGEAYENSAGGNTWKTYEWKSINRTTGLTTPAAEQAGVHLYPNPVRNMLYVASPCPVSHVTVYDLNAGIVRQTADAAAGIDLSAAAAGMYIVKVTFATNGKTKKPEYRLVRKNTP